MGLLYGRAGRLNTENGGFRPGRAVVEWRFDGAVVRRVTDARIIPGIEMQLRLH